VRGSKLGHVQPDFDIYEVRDKLPVAKYFTYEHDGQLDDVTIGLGSHWPEVHVRIHPNRGDIEVWGTFSANGRLRKVEFVARTDRAEVTAADLRMPAAARALKEWEIVGREITRQVLDGVLEKDAVIDGGAPTEALRMLSHPSARRQPQTVRRGAAREELLRQVAAAYREALASGNPKPRETLAARFGYSNEHIGRLLSQARRPRNGQPPLLGPARPGKAGEERLADE
jgi:hypothetical protein